MGVNGGVEAPPPLQGLPNGKGKALHPCTPHTSLGGNPLYLDCPLASREDESPIMVDRLVLGVCHPRKICMLILRTFKFTLHAH
jgi:hypothetical protein